jgi:hypothetical protein
MMRLLPQVFSLFFFLKFFHKGSKTLFTLLPEVIFATKIKIIAQPFNVISMLSRRYATLLEKRGVRRDKIGWYLNHCDDILFPDIMQNRMISG